MEGPWGYIMKDEGRKKIKIDKWGILGHPRGAIICAQLPRLIQVQLIKRGQNDFLSDQMIQNHVRGGLGCPRITHLSILNFFRPSSFIIYPKGPLYEFSSS